MPNLFVLSIGEQLHFFWGNLPHEGSPHRLDKTYEESSIEEGLFYPKIHVDEADLCGIAHQFNGAVYLEFPHNTGAMVFSRFGADKQLIRNLVCRHPFSQQRP